MIDKLPQLLVSVRKGADADIALRLETSILKFSAISAMTQSAPLRVTSTGHGLLDQWHAAIVDAQGMTELNAVESNAIMDSEFHQISVVDANTVEFNGISSAGFSSYTSGGHLAYYEPMGLSGYTSARADIKTRVGGDVALALNTDDGTLEIDAASGTLFIRLDEGSLSALPALEYFFDVELVGPGVVDAICSAESVFEVLPEVTTSV